MSRSLQLALAISVVFVFVFVASETEILLGSQSNLGSAIDVTVTIDTAANTVDLTIIGPSNKWFAIGFASETSDTNQTNSMIDSYAILAYAGDIVSEHKLTVTGPATLLTPAMITVTSDTINAVTSTRTIQITRNRVATSQQQTDGFHSFPSVATDFPFLWAYGLCANPCNSLNNVQKHSTQQRATGTFTVMNASQLSGGFEACTAPITLVNGVEAVIGRHIEDKMIEIEIWGPINKWFAFGFGDTSMNNTYAVIVTADSTVSERKLGKWAEGILITPSSYASVGDLTMTDDAQSGIRTMIMTRLWNDANTYDFTSFMNCTDSSIDIIAAVGWSGVNFGNHQSRGRSAIDRICGCDGVMSTTQEQQQNSEDTGCADNDFLQAEGSLNDFTIAVTMDCEAKTVSIDITYSKYSNNWFGIVFSDSMIGNALIWTTHNAENGETARDLALYQYLITDKIGDSVKYDVAAQWTKVSETINDEIINIVYTQSVDNADSFIDIYMTHLQMRWAKGDDNGLEVSYHDVAGRSSATLALDLLTGEAAVVADDISLQIVHGIIMFVAWGVLASFGIMSSAFKFLYPSGPKWFFVHRGVQCAVVVLHVVGVAVAVFFTQQKGNPHFNNVHMIIGLVVTILAILQPINAYFRSHPPADGWPDGAKPIKRKVWEFVHKASGYIAWILGGVAVMFGLQLIDEDRLAYIHMFGYCGLLFSIYILFSLIKLFRYFTPKNGTQTDDTNKHEKVRKNVEIQIASSAHTT